VTQTKLLHCGRDDNVEAVVMSSSKLFHLMQRGLFGR
jgi:hypothetical protein